MKQKGTFLMVKVTSSQIRSIGYDSETKTLYVEFPNGTVYEYYNVPIEKYQAMLIPTVSVGSYFIQNIKRDVAQLYSKTNLCVDDGVLFEEE